MGRTGLPHMVPSAGTVGSRVGRHGLPYLRSPICFAYALLNLYIFLYYILALPPQPALSASCPELRGRTEVSKQDELRRSSGEQRLRTFKSTCGTAARSQCLMAVCETSHPFLDLVGKGTWIFYERRNEKEGSASPQEYR